jgi:hypothetical protein
MIDGRHTPWRRMCSEATTMPSRNRRAIRTCLLSLLVLTCVVSSARAQGDTFTATAALKGSGGATASTPVTVSIRQYTSDGERNEMLAALKKGMPEARAFLAKRKDLGSIQIGGRLTTIKYAYAHTTPAGRLIAVAAVVPIALPDTGAPNAQPRAGFDAGVIFLDLPATAPASGQLIPNASVGVDADGSIVAEDSSGDVVRLADVAKK